MAPPSSVPAAVNDLIVQESVTGIVFPKSLKQPGGTKELSLFGVGVREKSFAILKVRVYAMGIYIDSEISSHVTRWKGKLASEILKDVSLSKALIEAPVEKGVSLVLVRDVGVDQFLRGFKDAIVPGLKACDKNCSVDKVLDEFSKVFQRQSLKKSTIIYFTWVQPSSVQIAVTKEVPIDASPPAFSTIESLPLAQALFEMFLGNNPVTATAKSNVITGVLQLLERTSIPLPGIA